MKLRYTKKKNIVPQINDCKYNYNVNNSFSDNVEIHLSVDVCNDEPIRPTNAKNTLNWVKKMS